MKPKAKFAYLLSMSGSVLSKDGIGRRLRLPRGSSALGKLVSKKEDTNAASVQQPACDPKEATEAVVSRKRLRRLPSLMLMAQRIMRESRGEQKPRHI